MRPTVKCLFYCCVFCLAHGIRVAETLEHVVFDCHSYAQLRSSSGVSAALALRDKRVSSLHREAWTWAQLRQLRKFFTDLTQHRTAMAGGSPRRARTHLSRRAQTLWPIADDDGTSSYDTN